MKPYKPELFTIEEVNQFFEISKGNSWRICAGTNPRTDDFSRGECIVNDKQLAAETLNDCLIALKQNVENTNPYTLYVFNMVKGQKKDQSAIIFQLNKAERYLPAIGSVGTDPQMIRLMEKMIENQNLMASKLAAMEMQDEEDEEDEEQPGAAGILGKLLEKPEVQDFLMNGAMAIVSGFTKKPQTYGGGVSGTVDQESINLLQSLFNKGVNNDTLKALDAMSESKLKSLLMML